MAPNGGDESTTVGTPNGAGNASNGFSTPVLTNSVVAEAAAGMHQHPPTAEEMASYATAAAGVATEPNTAGKFVIPSTGGDVTVEE
jgi:hypothetical protein